jgi:hypothetical protein
VIEERYSRLILKRWYERRLRVHVQLHSGQKLLCCFANDVRKPKQSLSESGNWLYFPTLIPMLSANLLPFSVFSWRLADVIAQGVQGCTIQFEFQAERNGILGISEDDVARDHLWQSIMKCSYSPRRTIGNRSMENGTKIA